MQPNANLRFTHLTLLSVALLAIYGWGVLCLEREYSSRAPVVVAAGD